MKKSAYLFLGMSFFCNGLISAQPASLPATEFEKRMNVQQLQLLDVRTAGEYQSGHLKNALQADWLNKEQFTERIKYLDKTNPILVYCASGIRSEQASKWLLDNGFKEVHHLKGGLTSWKMESKPVEGGENKIQLTLSSYKALSVSADIVLVDFGADWCPPCKVMQPVLTQLQAELKDKFTWVKVDGGIDINVMKAMQVDALPTFIIYKNGKETWRKKGVTQLSELKEKLGN